MAGVNVKLLGYQGLIRAFEELPKATGKNVLRRVLIKRGQPIAAHASAIAPDDPATPGKSIRFIAGTVLTKRQRGLHRKAFKDDRASVEVFVGQDVPPGGKASDPAGVQQEFGNINHGPQPSLRPAWDAGKAAVFDGITDDIGREIAKAAKRLAAKSARAAAKESAAKE